MGRKLIPVTRHHLIEPARGTIERNPNSNRATVDHPLRTHQGSTLGMCRSAAGRMFDPDRVPATVSLYSATADHQGPFKGHPATTVLPHTREFCRCTVQRNERP